MGCLVVFLGTVGLGQLLLWKDQRMEAQRREGLSPAERAREDSLEGERITAETKAKEDQELIVAARAQVRARLKDPESSRFGTAFVRNNVVCGYVNSKNSFGGYGGDQLFYAFGTLVYFDSDLKEMTKAEQKLPLEMRAACEGKP